MKIKFIATRISGNDGVSLEAGHWKAILRGMGHKVGFMAGELDQEGMLIPELSFKWPEVMHMHDMVAYGGESYQKVEREIYNWSGTIEGKLRENFSNGGKPDLIIVPNMLSLPMHFPAAVAVARVIEDLGIKTIARHHDFWWERNRYLNSSMFHFFEKWFPPKSRFINHVVINSIAQAELKKRTGITASIIGDSFDFNSNLDKLDSYSKNFRSDFDISADETVFLQATRIVPRKRIEISIDFVKKFGGKSVLVVAGASGDEGGDYEKKIRLYAKDSGIRVLFIGSRVSSERKISKKGWETGTAGGNRIYTLWDCYVNCDVVIYPPEIEGFGNQFVEAVYFKKPIVMTPYPVFKSDIEPLGFKVISLPDKVTNQSIQLLHNVLNTPQLYAKLTMENFDLGKHYFSYEATSAKITKLMSLRPGSNR